MKSKRLRNGRRSPSISPQAAAKKLEDEKKLAVSLFSGCDDSESGKGVSGGGTHLDDSLSSMASSAEALTPTRNESGFAIDKQQLDTISDSSSESAGSHQGSVPQESKFAAPRGALTFREDESATKPAQEHEQIAAETVKEREILALIAPVAKEDVVLKENQGIPAGAQKTSYVRFNSNGERVVEDAHQVFDELPQSDVATEDKDFPPLKGAAEKC